MPESETRSGLGGMVHVKRFVVGALGLAAFAVLIYGVMLGAEYALYLIVGFLGLVGAYIFGVLLENFYVVFFEDWKPSDDIEN